MCEVHPKVNNILFCSTSFNSSDRVSWLQALEAFNKETNTKRDAEEYVMLPSLQLCICLSLFVVLFVTFSGAGVNSVKKYKCTLQVGSLFLQIHTNLNLLKVFTGSHKKPPTCTYNCNNAIGFNQL